MKFKGFYINGVTQLDIIKVKGFFINDATQVEIVKAKVFFKNDITGVILFPLVSSPSPSQSSLPYLKVALKSFKLATKAFLCHLANEGG